ncbi:MAG: biosynthetic-type acetolactate synthase large subunit [Candidatus Korarchaeota archaeon]|nr:biosynthetic-type acetolactate synthase large subunit [Candidatus Korarchaeota archaeon]
MSDRVVDAIASLLPELGVNTLMGVIGGSIMPLYDALYPYRDEIEVVMFKHEQGAAHAADAYGRIARKPGVMVATSGPGATNLVTGIANAYMDSSPVMALTGQVATEVFGRDAFQETDMFGVVAPITKFVYQVKKPEEALPAVATAYKVASMGRPGPTLVDLPRDIQVAKKAEWNGELMPVDFSKYFPVEPSLEDIREAAELLKKAERPVILVGGGVYWANAWEEVLRLAEYMLSPVVTTLPGKNSVPFNHPLVMGPAGMHGRAEADAALANADVVLAVGTRFSDRTVGRFDEMREKKIIHIDLDASELGKNLPTAVAIRGDAKIALRMLLDVIKSVESEGRKKYVSWLQHVRREFERSMKEWEKEFNGLVPWRVLKTVRRSVPNDTITVTGVGGHQMWAEIHWDVLVPGTFVTSAGLGTMGFGIPAALGAKLAARDRQVVCIDGDGSFQMTLNNLSLVRDYDLPFIEVIFDNRALMLVKQWQMYLYDRRIIATEFKENPDFAKVADAYNIDYRRPESYDDLEKQVEWAVRNNEPLILDVLLDNEKDVVLPWVQPGKWLTQAILPPGMDVSLEWR